MDHAVLYSIEGCVKVPVYLLYYYVIKWSSDLSIISAMGYDYNNIMIYIGRIGR